MSPIKIGLLGAAGRMGSELTALLADGNPIEGALFELADPVVHRTSLSHIDGVATRTLSEPSREPVHLWLDFSAPEATLQLLETISTPILIGTTGFTQPQLEKIASYAHQQPVLLAPNTSLGLSILTRALQLDGLTPDRFSDVVVSESHHKRKKDAPSGSALKLLAQLEEQGYSEIPVHVTRGGGILGEHRVRFLSDGEEIEFVHRAHHRSLFARGALAGASFLLRQTEPRVYRMNEVWQRREP